MRIVFATNNQHKLSEIRQILGSRVEVLSLKDIGCNADIPETGSTLEENALQKAQYVYDNYHIDCFADDTGLEVDALAGAPGVYSARYAAMGSAPFAAPSPSVVSPSPSVVSPSPSVAVGCAAAVPQPKQGCWSAGDQPGTYRHDRRRRPSFASAQRPMAFSNSSPSSCLPADGQWHRRCQT